MSRYARQAKASLPRGEGAASRIRTRSVYLDRPDGSRGTEAPEIYMWAGTESLFVSADLRRFGLDDIQIRVQGMRLIFHGTLPPDLPAEKGEFRGERKSSRTFRHALDLPYEVHVDEAEMQNENGLISIVLKRKASPPRDRVAQSSFLASLERFFGENGNSSRPGLKDEITMLETLERYLAFQSVKGSAG